MLFIKLPVCRNVGQFYQYLISFNFTSIIYHHKDNSEIMKDRSDKKSKVQSKMSINKVLCIRVSQAPPSVIELLLLRQDSLPVISNLLIEISEHIMLF